MERTFAMIKPDGVQRGLIGEIVSRFEAKGIKIIGMKFMNVSQELAEKHYAVHKERPFYKGLVGFITSGPVVAMVLEGEEVIKVARSLMGATNPVDGKPGEIRFDLSSHIGRNLIHGSDGAETAKSEIALWFGDDLVDWERSEDQWVFE
ncbi:MAG: nucleoside-diphosphate kinase [Euryarchaeota archaeon]|nr:nucleoside-diphosphate kinase [Euryarchaeota archaeon]